MARFTDTYMANRKNKKKRLIKIYSFIFVLSFFVSFGVFWQLKLTGIAMAGDAHCETKEHIHTEECYEKKLICSFSEDEYDVSVTMGAAEKDVETEIAETEEKTALQVEASLETEADSTVAQSVEDHSEYETDTSVEATTETTEALEEYHNDPSHVHTDDCYEISLICTEAEHIHSLSCYSDVTADLETPDVWEKTIPKKEKSEPFGEYLARVASSQIGYTESDENFEVDDMGEKQWISRYGQWYGNPYGEWNGMFVSFCLGEAGLPAEFFPHKANNLSFITDLTSAELYVEGTDGIEIGDVIFFSEGSAIVTDIDEIDTNESDSAVITAVAGDVEGAVCEITVEYSLIEGYGDTSKAYDIYRESFPEAEGENSEESPEETDEGFTSTLESLIEVENNTAFMASEPTDASLSTSVSATVSWDDSSTNSHSANPVTVTLYADGVNTGKTLVLNTENDWEATFSNLWKYQLDENEEPIVDDEHLIEYSLRWSNIQNYSARASYSVIDTSSWNEVSSFENGESYLLVYNSNTAVSNFSSSTLSGQSVTVSNGKVTSEISDGMTWTPVVSGSTVKLMNKGTQRYLYLYRSGWSYSFRTNESSTATGTSLTYDTSTKRISATNSSTRYMQNYNSATSSSGSATAYTLYKRVPAYGIAYDISYSKLTMIAPDSTEKLPVFEHNKQIDYLGDGTANPETALWGDEFYRLYLDMTGKQEPVDLVFVVDQSNSMQTNSDMSFDGESGLQRIDALKKFLGGTDETEGFIKTFMDINAENRYAVVGFGGWFYENRVSGTSFSKDTAEEGYTYNTDAETIIGWTSESDATVIRNNINNNVHVYVDGTNYEAGLMKANEVFNQSTTNHRKIMVFLSDGAPTYYIDDNGDRQGNGQSSSIATCKDPSKDAFDDFRAAQPDVLVYTIGISADITSESEDTSQSPDVLKYMAKNEAAFLAITSDMSSLNLELKSLFYPKVVSIADHLSKYVRYYEENPDVKVIMKNIYTGVETVLYENGVNNNVVDNETNIILERVEYTPGDTSQFPTESTGTVEAVFGPNYSMLPEYVYTLSFNVKLTSTAAAEYVVSGYGGVVGDDNTDYLTNITSSNQPGYHSNNLATTTYTVSGETYQDVYTHPVVQVAKYELQVKKMAYGASRPILLPGAHFQIWRAALDGEEGLPLDNLDGKYVLVEDSVITDSSGLAAVPDLIEGTYYLIETKSPVGYHAHTDPIKFYIGANGIEVITPTVMAEGSSSDTILTVYNTTGYEMPSTGGGELYTILLGSVLTISSLTALTIKAVRTKKRQ